MTETHERGTWHVHWTAAYYHGDVTTDEIDAGLVQPYDVREADHNLLTTNGINALLTLLIGGGGTAFNNANAYLGVGDSTTAAAVGQTDLQAATNKVRQAMDASYPSVSGTTATFRATFGTSQANFSIQEQAIFNASSGGTMLNRRVTDLGVKTASSTMTLTMTISVS